ncbi:hypothetical protein CEAn_00682 [Coxiella endosymbiont of Amblyomma nuttalli]|nr:hypothetical protein CEAn_00682 [Coxiella endosymbiont of Amblyomma nuttalli]
MFLKLKSILLLLIIKTDTVQLASHFKRYNSKTKTKRQHQMIMGKTENEHRLN